MPLWLMCSISPVSVVRTDLGLPALMVPGVMGL